MTHWDRSSAGDWGANFGEGWIATVTLVGDEVCWVIRCNGRVRDNGCAPARDADPDQRVVRSLVEFVVATLQAIEEQAPTAPQEG